MPYCSIWMFPKGGVPPNHPFLIGFSIINHSFWGTTIFGNIHIIHSIRNSARICKKKATSNFPFPSWWRWPAQPWGSHGRNFSSTEPWSSCGVSELWCEAPFRFPFTDRRCFFQKVSSNPKHVKKELYKKCWGQFFEYCNCNDMPSTMISKSFEFVMRITTRYMPRLYC